MNKLFGNKSSDFENECLLVHNQYRKEHGVAPLTLNKEMSKMAQKWAEELAKKDLMSYSLNKEYGESIYTGWSPDANTKITGKDCVDKWYSEINEHSFGKEPEILKSGHFTQIVWKDTRELGIGSAKSKSGKLYVVANYSPPGNYSGQFTKNVLPPGAGSFAPINGNRNSTLERPSHPAPAPPSPQPKKDFSEMTSKLVKSLKSSSISGDDFERECLQAHNEYRWKHGVPPLTMNKKICKYAEEWAKVLAKKGKMEHRQQTEYGENIFYSWSTNPNHMVSGKDPVAKWYSEIKDHTFGKEPSSLASGHFTQVIWEDSKEVGVGLAKSKDGQIYVVANYYPPGNVIGSFAAKTCGVGGWCRGEAGRWRWLVALMAWTVLLVFALSYLPPRRAEPPDLDPESLLLQSDQLTDDELRANAQRRLPSLPLEYWHKNKDNKKKYYKSKECAPFPSIYDIQFDNIYWQTLRTVGNGTFYLYGAYFDTRNASKIGPAVRILGVHDRIKPTVVTHCQLWFEEMDQPVIVRNLEYKYLWNSKWGNFRDGALQPYLLACVLPKEVSHLEPAAVSLVEQQCDHAVTNLRVQYEHPITPSHKKDFAVCVKGLDFQHEDISVRLVEWIELLALLGADKIFIYELQVHPNIIKVLEHYSSRGLVEVMPMTLPGGQPNLPSLQHMYLKAKTTNKRQMELIPYNDCLYRQMYSYRYIALLDVDEVIVPLLDEDWKGLMRRVQPKSKPTAGKPPRTSYHASNVYFLDSLQHSHDWLVEVPRYMHMLQHVYRTRNFTKPGEYIKAFHDPERVLALHNHFPLACLGGACSSYPIETSDAQLQHYRADCVTALSKSCAELREDYVLDDTVWRWKDALIGRADAALRHLGFLQGTR